MWLCPINLFTLNQFSGVTIGNEVTRQILAIKFGLAYTNLAVISSPQSAVELLRELSPPHSLSLAQIPAMPSNLRANICARLMEIEIHNDLLHCSDES